MPSTVKIGIIGGSGLDDPDILLNRKELNVSTPFGEPSDSIISGQIEGVECFLLQGNCCFTIFTHTHMKTQHLPQRRHGRKHDVMPSNVNYRANIWALKELGCTHIIATTATGSLKEEIAPGHVVFPDQFIDRTTKRASTFYDGAETSPKGVCHISMASPFCDLLREVLISSAKQLGIAAHDKATVVTIEGPRFSSVAESNMFRAWGGHIINMTTVPEVVLAKEAGLLYAAIALSTDYDCWKQDHAHVEVAEVLKTLKENSDKALRIIRRSIPEIKNKDWDHVIGEAKEQLHNAVML
ncbi:S-methyl-5'-thioadenosine phosphorylase-like [Ornithodoros turicata]|uniref:S-methyl-5'-thioadenosine phosphorylase-like n=1 Tax=Ornithodoros turicata TaxID=34597 RepID=UPI00313A181C